MTNKNHNYTRKLLFESGGWITSESFLRSLEKAINMTMPGTKRVFFDLLKKIEGISIIGINLRINRNTNFSDILEILNEVGAVIGFDEAQNFRFYGRKGGKEFSSLISYSYDNLKNLHFIFTGSEVGLLHDFFVLTKYDSPMYARAIGEATLEPFSKEISKELLIRGCSEMGVEMKDEEIDKVVGIVGGIPGWLVEVGYSYAIEKNFEKALNKVFQKAEKLIKGEIKELEKKSVRYLLILRAISMGIDRWNKIKEFVEAKDRSVPSSRLSELLKNLEKMSWIKFTNEKYQIIDPVVEKVLKGI